MPAVTINANPPVTYNVAGSKRQQFYNVSGASGDTLTVGYNTVNKVNVDPNTVTSTAVTAGTITGTSIITFTTGGGAFTAVNVEVLGN